ncbi:MAG: class III poly(R)-hydroxyalkanoic acid synthase subunit PhaC [Gammaproteobacteria bacterium]
MNITMMLNISPNKSWRGATEKITVFQKDRIKLYYYAAKNKNNYTHPILINFAFINRPYILDLSVENSLINALIQADIDVYLIDWGYPCAGDFAITLSDHLTYYLHSCVEWIMHNHQLSQINLMGICQGGTLALCYSCLFSQNVKNLILITTPVDFHTHDNIIARIIQDIDVKPIMRSKRNIDGAQITQWFLALKPFSLLGKKMLTLINNMSNIDKLKLFYEMEYWIHDNPDQSGLCFSEFIRDFYQKNLLATGKLKLARRHVLLNQLTLPILNIVAENDHITPPSSAYALKSLVSHADYECITLPSGHIGIYFNVFSRQQLTKAILKHLSY